jgi:putative transposase
VHSTPQARLDFPGILHHVICRGDIVSDEEERNNFIERMGSITQKTGASLYAWALMRDRAHILLLSGLSCIFEFMRKLLTRYAISYNKRHTRHGYLFQNRYNLDRM